MLPQAFRFREQGRHRFRGGVHTQATDDCGDTGPYEFLQRNLRRLRCEARFAAAPDQVLMRIDQSWNCNEPCTVDVTHLNADIRPVCSSQVTNPGDLVANEQNRATSERLGCENLNS